MVLSAAQKAKLDRDAMQIRLEVIESQLTDHDATPLDEPTVDGLLPIANSFSPELEGYHQTISYSQPQDFADHEDAYKDLTLRIIRATAKLVLIKKSFPQAVVATPSSPYTSVSLKLPRIDLPLFNGKYEDWPSFSDLFIATVDKNPSLSGAQKLQYLKTYLRGDAEVLVKSFTITDNHYGEAWALLSDRFNNKREIVHSLCKRLLFQPVVKSENAHSIQALLNVTSECLRSLQSQGINIDFWDDLLVVSLIEKLDSVTRAEWAKQLKGTWLPTLKELQQFLEQHVRSLHARGMSGVKPSGGAKGSVSSHHVAVNSSFSKVHSCPVCNQSHPLYRCDTFSRASPAERSNMARRAAVCFNCLNKGHQTKSCISKSVCRKCNKRHNTLLHFDTKQAPLEGPSVTQPNQGSSQDNAASTSKRTIHTLFCENSSEKTDVLLKTALVNVKNSSGDDQVIRVLFDDCSESSFITAKCANALGIRPQPTSVEVIGISAASVTHVKSKVFVQLSSIVHEGMVTVEAYILPKVTGTLPKFTCNPSEWAHINGLQLADPHFHEPGEIDMLIGADIVASIMREGVRHGTKFSPVAQNTLFGWVLSGRVAIQNSKVIHTYHTTTIEDILQRFWTLEEVPDKRHFTEEEQACEDHFSTTHYRQENGRFVVHLPFNGSAHQLGESKSLALRRLHQLERRFTRNPEYQQQYIDFMREYESLGHMKQASDTDGEQAVYLPHHFVTKADSSSTKLRVVFNASSKTSSGLSLNDVLRVGPTIQCDLFNLLVKFRYHKVALKADITKMYRQFMVQEDDANYQKILWRENSNHPVKEYKLLTVTYGTASAPYLATKCLQQLANDEEAQLPLAAAMVRDDMYVDDMLSGAESSEEAIKAYNDVSELISRGGMQICKWATNDEKVLKQIPIDFRETDLSLNIDSDSTIKALGVKWNPACDSFTFTVNSFKNEYVTKRQLLSQLARVFDPLGWLTPVTVSAKLIFQQLWREQCGWDDIISGDLHQRWNIYQSQLSQLSDINIPRFVCIKSAVSFELHGFCDGSPKAYAATLFLKSVSAEGQVEIHLLAARSKVAPLNSQCIHRLELCSALLLAELINTIKPTLPFPHELYAWTDSMITLKRIASHSSRWKIFVANRVSKIQELVPAEHWHHVRGIENPADPASRGITPTELVNCQLWWTGPSFLQQSVYPVHPESVDMKAFESEQRPKPVFVAATVQQVFNSSDVISKFSSLSTLKRVIAYCLRFVFNCKNKLAKKIGAISTEELATSMLCMTKWVQRESFQEELKRLMKQEPVDNNSKLIQLKPILDSSGIIRVGGRLENMQASENRRHPVIIPTHHHLTTLIIRDCHLRNLHSGLTLTLATIQQQYWIPRGRDTVRHFIRKCVICRKCRAATCEQLMGNLPPARVNPSRSFQHTGIDFAGPFQIRISRGRGIKCQKCYFCIFVCFATKAVHLEVVMDMTSESFIATFKRFVSRRGVPTNVYSDCGTNFVGAEKELRDLYKNVQSNIVSNQFAEKGITWQFNVPSSPHRAGLWEAGVKSVKHHLRRVVGKLTMTLEQFGTLLCVIEACLNSRPLCALSSDPMDLEPLTPGHFLVGTALTAIPEKDATQINSNRLSYWQQTQQLAQRFWKRWSAEYVTSLQQRFKWVSKRANLHVNDLVVIKDEQLPPMKWKMGRIIETHAGADGCVRTVTLKTTNGTIKRPIVKLSPILYHTE